MKSIRFLAIVAAFSVILLDSSQGFPFHASCHITWNFGIPCSQVSSQLVKQIRKWSTSSCAPSARESCNYKLLSASSTQIRASHATPVHRYVDDLTFLFFPSKTSSTCMSKGYSKSTIFFAILDKGTNYCNMHNLITGSGLDKVPEYKETTSNSICTQYSSNNCTYY
ncbi:hypothetical protein TrispH2_007141 [Trichoplax sp. H2]|nr:hypothetical protein TrispH2_007141 [Trichoplax sp. H2]|eukprot:RDD40198.1 hypothetical protein TrispH2_007141 [Trichoplax sp. H2]